MKVGDLVKITLSKDPRLVGTIGIVVGNLNHYSFNVFNIHIPSENIVKPYHITRLEKVCKQET